MYTGDFFEGGGGRGEGDGRILERKMKLNR